MASQNSLATIKIEGGILSSDYLHQIASGNPEVPGLSSDAYHLAAGQRLSDAISNAWNVMRGRWTAFKDALESITEKDYAIGVTRDRLLLPLFQELGYGRILAAKATNIKGTDYPISHLWGQCPIHLMGWNVPIDKRTVGVAGASHTNPHSLVQQFLNVSEDHLWGFVSNGHLLRVIRDNKTLARQSFVEFDLETMFDSEGFSDFAVLFLLCHESRVEAEKPYECYLEKWVQAAARNGTRALDQLRFGVEEAIKEIGQGFLDEPANESLLSRLRNGSLTSAEYFRQILRLIYRMLFLFAAEDRGLLHPPQTDPVTQGIYRQYYSLGRIRDLAAKKAGTRHTDVWEGLELVFNALYGGTTQLGLPGLNSFLWSPNATDALNGARLSNKRVLSAVRHLTYIREANTRSRIDYRNLGSEELGSIYENVLELVPSLNVAAGIITFETSSISERSETNAHYTPSGLVDCLCDTALEPVIERALKMPDREQALLEINVCDPACGSGHFLVAAARRLAKRLAFVRTGELEPSPAEVQRALRDVIGRCIYGVDLNPMAVELCKVSLWFEALEPGKPLSFLDHKIKHGNSLIGATPAFIAEGIPDEAFTALEGDDKQFVSVLRRTNKQAREETNLLLFSGEIVWQAFARIKNGLVQIESMGDESLADIRRKQEDYEALLKADDYRSQKLIADAWCTAFTYKKTRSVTSVLTQEEFHIVSENPKSCPSNLRDTIQLEAAKFSFFHWHLEFPDVFTLTDDPQNELCGWNGGFDVVLGNPPWDRLEFKEKEWFTRRNPEIAIAATAAARERLIAQLSHSNPALYDSYLVALRQVETSSAFVRRSGRFPFCGKGNTNLYSLFTETSRTLISRDGLCGVVVPSGIATDDSTKEFVADTIKTSSLVSIFDFENKGIFPAVDSRFKFCLFTAGSGLARVADVAQFICFAHSVEDLKDPLRCYTLSPEDIVRLNPNTLTCPVFRSTTDAELNKHIYHRVPVFIRENDTQGNRWNATPQIEMVHMAHQSHLFEKRETLEANGWHLNGAVFHRDGETLLPLYEAKMFHHFNHRWATFRGDEWRDGLSETDDPRANALPRYWLPTDSLRFPAGVTWENRWLFAYRNITNTTNERTVIAAVVPQVPVGHSAPLIYPKVTDHKLYAALTANLASFCLDYCARQKIGGTNLTLGYLRQLPVIPPEVYFECFEWLGREESLRDWILPRVLELTYTAFDLRGFAEDCGYEGPPFRWNADRRFLLRCELDALYFHLYLGQPETWQKEPESLTRLFPAARCAVEYILATFPIVKKNDVKSYGRYRTKEITVQIYDAMAEAARTGQQYESLLDPPPAHPRAAYPTAVQ